MSESSTFAASTVIGSEMIGPTHPIVRGGFVGIVFCGHRDVLGELAGEATAHTPQKFVLPDPSLNPELDFATSSGSTLPTWAELDVRAVNGVCFMFTNVGHPAIDRIVHSGGRLGEHYIIAQGLCDGTREGHFIRELRSFVTECGRDPRIAILGFGHQGQRIARCLVDELAVSPQQLAAWDSTPQSAAVAAAMGLNALDEEIDFADFDGVIASPLSRYERIVNIVNRAQMHAIKVFDNARRPSGLESWVHDGRVALDESARRVLTVERDLLVADDPCVDTLHLAVHIIREERRVLAGVNVPHLFAGQSSELSCMSRINVSDRWTGDGLSRETWDGFHRGFVSLRTRADVGMFAAREFCLERWPDATRTVFPSSHHVDLGATAFERLLRSHLDCRETITSMQTPLQRVTLGVVAAHYSEQRPMIEIGSALGGSALHLAAATDRRRPQIISIDPDAATRDIMRFVFERHGQLDRLHQIVSTSDDAMAELSHMRESCGLVFIDGLHTCAAVRSDFSNYASMVAVGGAMAFHDVCPALHSVMEAVTEHVLRDERFRAVCLVDGLLVLERVS